MSSLARNERQVLAVTPESSSIENEVQKMQKVSISGLHQCITISNVTMHLKINMYESPKVNSNLQSMKQLNTEHISQLKSFGFWVWERVVCIVDFKSSTSINLFMISDKILCDKRSQLSLYVWPGVLKSGDATMKRHKQLKTV